MSQQTFPIPDIIATIFSNPSAWLPLYSDLQWAAKGKSFGRRLKPYRRLDIAGAPTLAREICGQHLTGTTANYAICDELYCP